jgi:hypothetical protein
VKSERKSIGVSKPLEISIIVGSVKLFDIDTLFQACGISKVITALAVVKRIDSI